MWTPARVAHLMAAHALGGARAARCGACGGEPVDGGHGGVALGGWEVVAAADPRATRAQPPHAAAMLGGVSPSARRPRRRAVSVPVLGGARLAIEVASARSWACQGLARAQQRRAVGLDDLVGDPLEVLAGPGVVGQRDEAVAELGDAEAPTPATRRCEASTVPVASGR